MRGGVVAYLRVSTEEQRERHTIETQRSQLQAYCRENGITYSEFADEGVSGTVPFARRPQGRRLLEAAKRKEIQELLVYKLDRIGRDTIDTLSTLVEFLRHGVKVVSKTEGVVENNAQGWLKMGMHSVWAEYERHQIIERSVDASRRLAEGGTWLGGIVPYGYRKQGQGREARLIPATDPIPGCESFSEAAVIRRIFAMSAEGKSCFVIADHLQTLGVPPAYTAVGRTVLRGKRKQTTSGIWRPSRVRNLIVNKTYMGVHEYGKRKKIDAGGDDGIKRLRFNARENWIVRSCPAIVDEDLWKRANASLHQNQIAAMAHAKHQYLLRGLIKCGLCNLTYIGVAVTGRNTFLYRCNGKHGARGLYGLHGQRCPSKSLNGPAIEGAVWTDIETFLAKPALVLKDLKNQLASHENFQRVRDRIKELERALESKTAAKERAQTLFIDGHITREELNKQSRRIELVAVRNGQELEKLRRESEETNSDITALRNAHSLLSDLRDNLDSGLSFEVRRRIVEALVGSIQVESIEGVKEPKIKIEYRFEPHFERYQKWSRAQGSNVLSLSDTGRGSWRRSK